MNDKAINRGLGWKPDLPDVRDRIYRPPQMLGLLAPQLPAVVDLRPKCGPVRDQGSLGACTGFAIASALAHLHHDDGDKFAAHDLSPLFIYYQERKLEGTISEDSGAYIRDGIKVVASDGAPHEKRWPYIIKRYRWKPSVAAYRDAAKNLVGTYMRLSTLTDMRQCLADGFPFVFGFTVYPDLFSSAVARSGILPLPNGSNAPLGGHAVLAVGYDDQSQRFLVQNSWGDDWGQQGFFQMPYAYLASRSLSDDFWTVRAG